MSTSKNFDRICAAVLIASLLLTALFMNGAALGLDTASRDMGYESRLFDPSKVHTLSIVIDDWDGFLDTCENEEYAACSVVIDNESYKNIGLRAKGNTSLTTVRSMDSDRYSLKLEFDHYETGKTYHGLDKLCLNNIIQDNTYMKDYLTYRMMGEFGVSAPLCSYVWITVNGEDWGLYLAVEGVEGSFLQRNYGDNYGDLYKPDSQSFGGGGRGFGRDFRMSEFMDEFNAQNDTDSSSNTSATDSSSSANGADSSSNTRNMSRRRGSQNGFPFPGSTQSGFPFPGSTQSGFPFPGSTQSGFPFPGSTQSGFPAPGGFPTPGNGDQNGGGGFPGGGMRGMGSDDVKLKYSDDDPDSYSSIFGNAKTDVTDADKCRLIASLKALGEMSDLESVVDIDAALRYFVVHNYVVNGDSYTGGMIHNYYLYEKDGRLSMIPWDYNLAFGGFQGGSASGSVNDPIDTPLSVSGNGDRPMADWFLQQDEYTEQYHAYFDDFLNTVDVFSIIDEAYTLIAPYVERDPTKFCTYEEFVKGAETLRTFCELRTESVRGQLDGTIPATDDGQSADSSALIDPGSLTISDMGSMGFGGGGRPGGRSSDSGNGSSGNSENAPPAMDADNPDASSGTDADSETGTDSRPTFSGGGGFPGAGNGDGNFPGGGNGGFPGNGNGNGGFPDPFGGADNASGAGLLSAEAWTWLGVSAAVLLAGLVTARRARRRTA
ncbi:MAG: CotH kinase family protein [Oscillospiraceae bacterium]|nr:CotH kinase family protein [Oscillospiraceae bacterium]